MKSYIEAIRREKARRDALGLKLFKVNTAFHPELGFSRLPVIEAKNMSDAISQARERFGNDAKVTIGVNVYGENWSALTYKSFSIAIKEVK